MNQYQEINPINYSRPPRRQQKKYTQIMEPKPSNESNAGKSYKKIMPTSNNSQSIYNKENSWMNCKSNVNIKFQGEKSTVMDRSIDKGGRERSSSIMNKSHVDYSSKNYPPYVPQNKTKTRSRWETTDYVNHSGYDNFQCNPTPNKAPEIVQQSRNKVYSKNRKYLKDYNQYKSMGGETYFENSTVSYDMPIDQGYPRFGYEPKKQVQCVPRDTYNSNNSNHNIPLYERLKSYNQEPVQSSNDSKNSILHKTYSYNEDIDNSGIKQCYYLNQSLGGSRLNDYTYKAKQDLYSSVRVKCDPTPVSTVNDLSLSRKLIKRPESIKQPDLDDFYIGQCKGQGRFGKVYMAIHKRTGFLCALKKIKKESVKYMMDQFIQEVKIQMFLNHPKLVKVYGYFADKEHFYMLVEYMEEGSLYSLMKKNKKFQEKEAAQKLFQICEGIKEMHSLNIVHRDLKPENVVISHGVCKICDFGWAAICQDRRQTYCGTLDYVCPEIVEGNAYDSSVDIWCIGVLAYELMTGKAPFYDISRQKTIQKIKSCKIDSFPPHLSKKTIDFIQMILKKNPDCRVGVQQLLDSQFLVHCRK